MVFIKKAHAFGFLLEKHLQKRTKVRCYQLWLGLRKVELILEGGSIHDIFSLNKNDKKSDEDTLGSFVHVSKNMGTNQRLIKPFHASKVLIICCIQTPSL